MAMAEVSRQMKQVNPKYTWREWLIVPAYEQAQKGDFSLIHELQQILASPYEEQSKQVEEKYYRLRPLEYFSAGGVSHYSCSS
ncbi:selenoprotein [Vibrio ishigakensis]|uniref:Selenoprotein n=1 Tax=Vibrio ishigakensis TaxID=1481914 RepID=A0A0B8Q7W7_9VIBR|nr:selenoprotein [Vibrio ishigakensis]